MQVLPAVVEQIVWMVKEELRRSGGDIRRAADQYVDTIVTNAVLNVRGRLDARQRDATKAFYVVSNDPSSHLNDNRSNSSWAQTATQMSMHYRASQPCKQTDADDDDGADSDDVDIDIDDDDDDMSVCPMYDVKQHPAPGIASEPSSGSSSSSTVSSQGHSPSDAAEFYPCGKKARKDRCDQTSDQRDRRKCDCEAADSGQDKAKNCRSCGRAKHKCDCGQGKQPQQQNCRSKDRSPADCGGSRKRKSVRMRKSCSCLDQDSAEKDDFKDRSSSRFVIIGISINYSSLC